MSFFPFNLSAAEKDPHFAGFVAAIDTRKVTLDVPDDSLDRISVGKYATLPIGNLDEWLVGHIDRIVCKAQYVSPPADRSQAVADKGAEGDLVVGLMQGNAVTITLVGTVKRTTNEKGEVSYRFTRSIVNVPDVHASCFVLREKAWKYLRDCL
jgi:hypothetical protein